jgi:hypothetical protein
MDREVLVLTNGDLFNLREITFTGWQTRRETRPLGAHDEGSMECTVETADISFTTHPGPLAVNQSGQISKDDLFYELTVLAIEDRSDHLRVSGSVLRRYDVSLPD